MSTPETAVSAFLLGDAAEHGPLALFLHDERGRMLAVNDAACRLTGFSRVELLALMAPTVNADPEEGRRLMGELERRRLSAGRTTIVRKDGSELEIEFRGGPTRASGLPYLLVSAWPAA